MKHLFISLVTALVFANTGFADEYEIGFKDSAETNPTFEELKPYKRGRGVRDAKNGRNLYFFCFKNFEGTDDCSEGQFGVVFDRNGKRDLLDKEEDYGKVHYAGPVITIQNKSQFQDAWADKVRVAHKYPKFGFKITKKFYKKPDNGNKFNIYEKIGLFGAAPASSGTAVFYLAYGFPSVAELALAAGALYFSAPVIADLGVNTYKAVIKTPFVAVERAYKWLFQRHKSGPDIIDAIYSKELTSWQYKPLRVSESKMDQILALVNAYAPKAAEVKP